MRTAWPGLSEPCCTPLVRHGGTWLKLEGCQTTGSVKYRMVYARVTAALAAGHITPRSMLTEVTSGSTGVALAYVGSVLGLRVELHAYENACPQKCARIREYGARLILHPLDTPMAQLLEHVAAQTQHGHWHLRQYDRQSALGSYQAFGREIIRQLQENGDTVPRHFACPVGTGGLIQGVGACLREAYPGLHIVAVEPEPGTSIAGMRNTQLLHMGAADPYRRDFPDQRLVVPSSGGPVRVGVVTLGESASAVYTALQLRGWQSGLMIAPD